MKSGDEMNFKQLAQERCSIRKYLEKEVEQEKLETIFSIAQLAPSAANFQPVRYYILQSDQAKETISKLTKYTFNAPVWILVAYDSKVSWKNKYRGDDNGVIDCSIAITHIMLAATELGLGTCWVGSFDIDLAKRLYDLADNIQPVALLPLGYPDLSQADNPNHTKRIPITNHIKKL